MKPHEQTLLDRYLDCTLSDAEAAELQQLLRESPQARRRLRDMAAIDAKLTELAAGCSATVDLLCSELASAPRVERTVCAPAITRAVTPIAALISLRSLSGVCVGLLIGVVCSSMAWAYTVPHWRPSLAKFISLIEESFESTERLAVTGLPLETDVWSGDYSQITGQVDQVRPADGVRMLRVLRADYEGKMPADGYIGEVYRLVDIRHFHPSTADGGSVIRVSARFNSIALPSDDIYHCSLSVYALDQETATGGATLDASHLAAMSLATTQRNCEILDSDPATWQASSTEMLIPPGTDHLLLRFAIGHGGRDRNLNMVTFAGHFIDDIRVSLMRRN